MMTEIWRLELHSSPHAYPPTHQGAAPQRSSLWFRVVDATGERWVDVTDRAVDVRAVYDAAVAMEGGSETRKGGEQPSEQVSEQALRELARVHLGPEVRYLGTTIDAAPWARETLALRARVAELEERLASKWTAELDNEARRQRQAGAAWMKEQAAERALAVLGDEDGRGCEVDGYDQHDTVHKIVNVIRGLALDELARGVSRKEVE